MDARAVTLLEPEHIAVRQLPLARRKTDDVVIDVAWSGVSAGTERLLYSGRMPTFPGMGYPLVPGYESVGTVIEASRESGFAEGDVVFVPGAQCFADMRCLFGGTASRLAVEGRRVARLPDGVGHDGTLVALAATAHRALARANVDPSKPLLIIGHGAVGRLVARFAKRAGAKNVTVWEHSEIRASGANGYRVMHETDDTAKDYAVAIDVSGDVAMVDVAISRLAKNGRMVLAGFYAGRVEFAFPPAFIREIEIVVAAEWQRTDLDAAVNAIADDANLIKGLVTHRYDAADAEAAYMTAFTDPTCLKMITDWGQPV